MTPVRPRRRWRLGTLVPTAALAVVSVAVAVTTAADSPSAPRSKVASFADGVPFGHLDSIPQTPGGVRATGWTFDPNSVGQALTVSWVVDRKWTGTTTAAVDRPDVAKVYPGAGAAHGFSMFVPIGEGTHTVCIVAANVGKGSDLTLGCVTKLFDYGPGGSLDTVSARSGHLHVRGWTADWDSRRAPITTTIKIDGVGHTVLANQFRPDVAAVFTSVGNYHGFDSSLAAGQGRHTVCVTARNIGYGSDNVLGCKTVTLNDSPGGNVDLVAQQSGKLRVRGWAFDREKPAATISVSIRVDSGAPRIFTANTVRTDVAKAYPSAGQYHGYDQLLTLSEGSHRVCVVARNIGYGSDQLLAGCRTVTLTFTPTVALTSLTATTTGVSFGGWATDPDTSAPISVRIAIDGRVRTTMVAKAAGPTNSGHNFTGSLNSTSGRRTVCVTAVNVLYGRANSRASCRSITLALSPRGTFDSLTRSGQNLIVTGWTIDPDTATTPTSVAITLDGRAAGTYRASATRTDVARVYPFAGAGHGFSTAVAATDGKHTVCVTAKNVSGGSDTNLGCRLIIAAHPAAPSAPRSVQAVAGYGSATVSWTAPASDGGAPWSSFVVVASPGGRTVTASATARSVTMTGLATNASYTFTVQAVNVAGRSAQGTSIRITTQSGPAPQRTPAPISTSRYIRNIRGSSATEQALLRAEGAADARANPSGHRYLVLLDIGGQNQAYGGVVLSATTRFVGYADLVRDVKAYIDGYHSAQRATAPTTIAIGTNSDMDVNATTGRAWATAVVNPLFSYARKYADLTISGANDVEPGFSASYTSSRNWLSGYLAATSAQFIFNGSADGCAWTVTNRGCNNGWTMAGLYTLAAGAAPTRSINLPQVYNYTMADQWKFISLTGLGQGKPRINFGGPLTEYTACAQAGSCGSIGGVSAWTRMWNNLQSQAQLRVSSLPYATDLRIDR